MYHVHHRAHTRTQHCISPAHTLCAMPYHAPLHWKIRVDKSKGDIGLSLTNNPSGVGVTVCADP